MTAAVGRVTSLDGLRGIAALVVLVHHSLLLVPSFASPYFVNDAQAGNAIVWAMTYTPLHLLWMGTEAVFVFFVLSGIVLALQVTRSRSFTWKSYFPSRLVRLYLPVFAAILFGLLLVTLVPRGDGNESFSLWALDRAREYSLSGIARDSILVFGTSGVISPLWSLRWEVIFSLLLPVYIFLALRPRGAVAIKGLVLLITMLVAAYLDLGFLIYLPVFGLGVLVAARWEQFIDVGNRINSKSNPKSRWAVTASLAALLLTSSWIARGFGADEVHARLLWPLVALGAIAAVLFAVSCPWAIDRLNGRVVSWAAKISFSLYLVHEPILLTARYAMPGLPEWVAMLVGIPLALVVAELFSRYVEQPSHMIAKRVQTRLRRLTSQNITTPVQ